MTGASDPPGRGAGEVPPLRFPHSLCASCAAHRYVDTKTSRFVMCTALPVKYPRQPVESCPAYSREPS